jgi:hypothetical protein
VLSAPNKSTKPNGSHLTGEGRDMTDNLAENQGYKWNGSPVIELQAQLKTEFQKS